MSGKPTWGEGCYAEAGIYVDGTSGPPALVVDAVELTGFDAPCCHTMYVDKPMAGHNLMQAIARVNRVFKDKTGGIVVDYIGIGAELKKALKAYTDAKGKGQPTLRAEEALRVLAAKMDALRGLFHGFDYSEYKTKALQLLPPTANHILGLEKKNEKTGKERFLDIMASVTKSYSLCCTLDEAAEYHHEIAFLSAVRAAIVKNTTVDKKLVQEQKNSAMKQILDNAVIVEGVIDVFALANLDKPNIGLLSDEFLADVRNMPLQNLAIEITEKPRESTSVDWQVRDSVRAKLRNLVRRLLRKYKYPPDSQLAAIELVMKQAESLAYEWATEWTRLQSRSSINAALVPCVRVYVRPLIRHCERDLLYGIAQHQ